MRIKVIKIFGWLLVLTLLGGGLYYLQLSNRHKAIVKTTILHKSGLGGDWQVSYGGRQTDFYSPLFFVDNIYTSMEGPKAMRGFQINPSTEDLLWINGYETTVVAADGLTELSRDFMCHTNLDYYDQSYYSKWQIPNRIGSNYPRLATLTNGMESYHYPEGFGFPIKANEYLYLSTQILNHNLKESLFGVRHKVSIFHKADSPDIKPLRPLTVFMMLPYDGENPFDNEAAKTDPSVCIPVETKNHSYQDSDGNMRSGHWVVFPGKQTYRSDISAQLEVKDSIQVHHIATHLHPFATSLKLINTDTQKVLFTADAENHLDRVGLAKITEYSSTEGFTLYADQQYELVLEVNNTSTTKQDMMASMFFGIYDADLDARLKSRFEN
ncbi:hypothetical protein BTO09_11100 [Gilvibacter sp. SZ-19]|uniref:hypothetical protein n=1 Tax=Gilvibacter sp. SZ-19 TaxID=754429 RepID=UPI000B3C5607|nr:hypothetical protein [Gilvibacter sp. SZ-19]ARV12863.1 hypothetical protein BTO09_11100 [Gilvibacter sp. SZ-19]